MSSETSRAEMKQLLENYGSLLTNKQAAFARAFFVDEKSFSEIARDHRISRQAVHETVHNVRKMLHFYNEKLNSGRSESASTNATVNSACEKLNALKGKIAHRGIIYNVDWILHEIDHVIELLEREE